MAADPQVAFANTSAFASSFVWDFGDGETSTEISPVHTYINPGTYTVQLIATACERADTAVSVITVPGSVGLVERPQPLELAVYPNPVGSILHLVYLPFRTAEYRIVSVTGSTVASGKLQRASSSIDVAAVPEGTYILQLLAPNGVVGFATFVKAPR
jgi:PKD repeat protein